MAEVPVDVDSLLSALWAARGALRASPVPPNPPDAMPRREVEAEAVSS